MYHNSLIGAILPPTPGGHEQLNWADISKHLKYSTESSTEGIPETRLHWGHGLLIGWLDEENDVHAMEFSTKI